MYVKSLSINNIGPFSSDKFQLSLKWNNEEGVDLKGWNVLLGGNGCGKTSFIRSMALGLIGPNDAQYLHQVWSRWVNSEFKNTKSYIIVGVLTHNCDKDINNVPFIVKNMGLGMYLESVNGKPHRPVSAQDIKGYVSSQPLKGFDGVRTPLDHIWGRSSGWFSCSFGPYRRFSGGDPKYADAYLQNPKASPHISAFGEDAALGGTLQWLKDQARPSRNVEGHGIIELIKNIVNSDKFLPENTVLHDIDEDGVYFKDGAGSIVGIEQLGDGYRSALCIAIEILHQLILAFDIEELTTKGKPTEIIIPGVVLIDEVDAHLHPTWQQRIGFWLTKRFPEMQFIVTTHSPLICQAATTVFKLPTLGSNEEGRFLNQQELDRLRYGNILEAYASEAFGKIERSEEGKQKLERLSELERLSWERELTEEERAEQANLQAIFIASPVGM